MDGANNSLTETNEITEEQAMKALARFGKAFGGYKMIDVPEPECLSLIHI